MNGNPYQVLGTTVPTLLGRQRVFDQIVRQLTKQSPEHVSLVGPRHYGKSVILQGLAEHFRTGQKDYLTAAYWDLRHDTPDSDAAFIKGFAASLKKALAANGSELAEFLDTSSANVVDLVTLVLDEMAKQKTRILAILDGFDHVLAKVSVSRNTWDAMRSFAQKTSLLLATGSRQRLRELCKTEESRTSDFWENFPNPISVGKLEEHDLDGFLQPFTVRKTILDGSARKEILNWTGGVPVLAAAMMEMLFEEAKDGITLSKPDIDRVGKSVLETRRDLVESLWDDCSEEIKADLAELHKRTSLPLSEVQNECRREMEHRGFVKVSGSTMASACNLMGAFAADQSSGIDGLRRLFGDLSRFQSNIQSLLELRASQLVKADPTLRGFIQKAIRDISEPAHAIVWGRSISDRALDLIWDKELPANRSLPQEWIDNWKFAGVNWSDDQGKLPRRRGAQCNILRLITGTENSQRLAKYVTKPSYLLLDHLQSIGDFGQHREDNVSLGFATAICMAAIELCDSLTRDFARP
jgi:hypothetical protein